MAGVWRETVWRLPYLEVSVRFQELEGAGWLRNGHAAGETGLQNPGAGRSLSVQLAPPHQTWPISPGRGVQLRFSNNDDDNSDNELPLMTSHGCLSRCHDPISFPAGKSARLESPSIPLTDEEEAFLAPGMNSVFGDQFWAVLNSDS